MNPQTKKKLQKFVILLLYAIFSLITRPIFSYKLNQIHLQNQVPSLLGERLHKTSQCRKIRGLGSPVNIFRRFFQQNVRYFMEENKNTRLNLLYYRESTEEVSTHRYIFSIEKASSKSLEYIGIISMVPDFEFDSKNFQHYITRYVQDRDFNIVRSLIGVHDAEKNYRLKCLNMKNDLVKSLLEKPVMPYTCFSGNQTGLYNKKNFKMLFKKNFEAIQGVLKEYGFEVSVSDLLLDQKVVDVIDRVYKKERAIKEDLKRLKQQLYLGGKRDHAEILRKSYKGNLIRCRDVLDIRNKCSFMDGKCLSINEAQQLRNHLVLLYMANQRKVLSQASLNGNYKNFHI